jgi:predicted dienelactone hydrolase
MHVGFMEGLSFDTHRQNWSGDGPRPLAWSVWYPAPDSAIEYPVSAASWFREELLARDAALNPSNKSYPLVLLSHGAGGVASGLGWLAYRLAKRGFVALAVNHHGNTGAKPFMAEGFLCLWERALDLSALIGDEGWRSKLTGDVSENAGVAGFSAGAYAAMLLMGARIAYSQFEPENPVKSPVRGPREFPNLADEIPALLKRNAVFRKSWECRKESYVDNRFHAALALAPGRSVLGFEKQSLLQIDKPVRILAGEVDTIAPPEQCSGWLHICVTGSALEVMPNAGHYVFLPEPSPLGLAKEPEVFVDAPGVDRKAVHERVALTAIELFRSVS